MKCTKCKAEVALSGLDEELAADAVSVGSMPLKGGGIGAWPVCEGCLPLAMVAGFFPFAEVGTPECDELLKSAEHNF